jgi:23S rRNA (cytosine1962-C5)-methyltransferase
MSSAGMDQRKQLIARVLQKLLSPRAILERNDIGARKFEGLPDASGVLTGRLPADELRAWPVWINGLKFEVDLEAGHKTGFYLDQQVNQARIAELARGARVLDAFCFIGGFGLHAARAGASFVIGVDQSESSVRVAEHLAQRNGLEDRCQFVAANAFDWLRAQTTAAGEKPEAFDMVILDPPSFTRNRAAVPDALRGYKEIHLRALRLLRPGGILATFCCSHHVDARTFERTVGEACLDARRPVRRLAIYTQAPDHPILPAIPETEYLKGFAYEVLAP